ncbi:MAG: hypothetical protein AMJ56_17440 [Anaerolineae bacterium SG8_19]|nr:MAG: hypothetical protein AMJ56_17440 [Anaerolineae bacterium SG8_19]
MESDKQPITVPCPDCEHEIRLGANLKKHDKVTCPNCWAYLEVISLDPLELAWEDAELDADWQVDLNEENDLS